MNTKTAARELTDIAAIRLSDISLSISVICEILAPIRDEPEAQCAYFGIDIPRKEASRSSIVAITTVLFRGVLDSAYPLELEGIELIFRGEGLKRIARITVRQPGYENILKLTPEDIGKPGPYPGVGCWIYDATLV